MPSSWAFFTLFRRHHSPHSNNSVIRPGHPPSPHIHSSFPSLPSTRPYVSLSTLHCSLHRLPGLSLCPTSYQMIMSQHAASSVTSILIHTRKDSVRHLRIWAYLAASPYKDVGNIYCTQRRRKGLLPCIKSET